MHCNFSATSNTVCNDHPYVVFENFLEKLRQKIASYVIFCLSFGTKMIFCHLLYER